MAVKNLKDFLVVMVNSIIQTVVEFGSRFILDLDKKKRVVLNL